MVQHDPVVEKPCPGCEVFAQVQGKDLLRILRWTGHQWLWDKDPFPEDTIVSWSYSSVLRSVQLTSAMPGVLTVEYGTPINKPVRWWSRLCEPPEVEGHWMDFSKPLGSLSPDRQARGKKAWKRKCQAMLQQEVDQGRLAPECAADLLWGIGLD